MWKRIKLEQKFKVAYDGITPCIIDRELCSKIIILVLLSVQGRTLI